MSNRKLSQRELFRHLISTGKIDRASLPKPLNRKQRESLQQATERLATELAKRKEEEPPF